jgi:hypothetical protein
MFEFQIASEIFRNDALAFQRYIRLYHLKHMVKTFFEEDDGAEC